MQFSTLKICGVLSLAALLGACSQPAAQIVMKGQNSYAKADFGLPNTHYEPQVASNDYVQAAPVAEVTAVPMAKPEMQPQVQQVATASPDDYQPAASTVDVRSQGAMGIEMKELEPLTAAKAEPVSAPVNPISLPEPQAAPMAVSQGKSLPEAHDAMASATHGNFIWPVKGKVISGFGPKPGGAYNDGINIAGRQGEPIVAAADGEVVYSGNELRGYGNMIILRHKDGLMSAYAHADRIIVSKGDKVKQGVAIATVGTTGGVEQAQVHFGIRKDKAPVDPMGYLASSNMASR